jgi:hypothetical protein
MNNDFIQKHTDKITGVLSCFDRVVFKGYLPISSAVGMEAFMGRQGLLLKDFKNFVPKQARRLQEHAQEFCRRWERPYRHLEGASRKEDLVRRILQEQPVAEGLVCVLAAVEGCGSFRLAYGQGRPRLLNARRKCLCLYFYFIDRKLGLLHVRIQTWFPFSIQVCLNGHDWLQREMDRLGLKYRKVDNAFTWVEDAPKAQVLSDKFVKMNWPGILGSLARKVCPLLGDLLAGMEYYWVTDQAEYATDVMFKDRPALKCLYEKLLRHATVCFGAEDVMTFLGRKLCPQFAGEVLTESKKRWPGARVKHRMKENWIKMYDKHGIVLRIETVLNQPREFQVRRPGWRKGRRVVGWFPMAKGVSNLYRYQEVCLAANSRYLKALAVVDDPSQAVEGLHRLCQPASWRGRKRRGLNPLRADDAALIAACLRGEYAIAGFRNRDLAGHLVGAPSPDPTQRRRQNARVTRRIQLLRAHGLLAKVPRSRRYHPTHQGRALMTAAIQVRAELPGLIHRAAS